MDRNAPLTTDINDLCFIDDETRALEGLMREEWGDITSTSVQRYAASSKVIIVTYAIGKGEVKEWVLEDFSKTLKWRDVPPDLAKFMQRVRKGEAWFIAFNSAFDRTTLNKGMVADSKRDVIEVEEMLDMAVQGAAANMPTTLDATAKRLGHEGKLDTGKKLIKLFCVAGGATPQSHPKEWMEFRDYAKKDVEALRYCYECTLPLTAGQWREFWAAERINDRGLPVDPEFLEKAAKLAKEYTAEVNNRVDDISDGVLRTAKQHKAIAQWVWDRVEGVPDGQSTMVKRYEEDAEGGDLLPAKIGLDRNRTKRLMALIDRLNDEFGLTDEEDAVRRLLIEKEFGASASPGKFQKAFDAMDRFERLPNQYVFNGAQQTGRFSSRGVQLHNMTNRALPNEDEAIEAVLDEIGLEGFERVTGNAGMGLSRIIRPMIAAKKGRTMVWGDWSNIEARVLPWLARAEDRLDIFRAVDADKSNPDVYVISAAGMDGHDVHELWAAYKDETHPMHKVAKQGRQKGKIAELSLGFGGASGALLNMAANYGMAFTEEEAAPIVKAWRASNPWCTTYWDDVWEAFCQAVTNPGLLFEAGRVAYLALPDYIGGTTVLCFLPDGRALCYGAVRFETREVENPKTGKMEMKSQYTFSGGYGRKGLWYGTLVENITQATAASLLRSTLVPLEYDRRDEIMIDGHTHDEIIGECDDTPVAIRRAKAALHHEMTKGESWTDGLPLAADISTHWFYTKAVD